MSNCWVLNTPHYFEMSRSSSSQMFFKIGILNNFTIFTGKHLYWSLFLLKLQALRPTTLFKRDSNTGVFLWILRNFVEWLFLYNTFDHLSSGKLGLNEEVGCQNLFPLLLSFVFCTTLWLLSHLVIKVAPLCNKNCPTLYCLPDFVIPLAPFCDSKKLSRL